MPPRSSSQRRPPTIFPCLRLRLRHSSREQNSRLPAVQAQPAEPEPEPVRPASKGLPLGMVLQACPDIVNYARNGISDWRDFIATAAVVRSVYGISPSAWADACETMGEGDAATVVAAILQRGDAIKSAGGYLRSLTEKARAGKFSTGPIIMSLWRARTREPMRA